MDPDFNQKNRPCRYSASWRSRHGPVFGRLSVGLGKRTQNHQFGGKLFKLDCQLGMAI